MAIDRKAALDFAKKYWNRACPDEKFAVERGYVSLDAKRTSLGVSETKGFELYFVSNGGTGEDAVFGRVVNGSLVDQTDPVWTDTKDHMNDCTHYVSNCLIREGLPIKEEDKARKLIRKLLSDESKGFAVTLVEETDKGQGQRIIDSGVFKPGDVVGYCKVKGDYHHSAMFTGPDTCQKDAYGGITCHSVCRYGGLTASWKVTDDDAWFINGNAGTYTLIHFTEDDEPLAIGWLMGWWQLGKHYYLISANGTATWTKTAPTKADSQPIHASHKAMLFQVGKKVVFIWKQGRGSVSVESWNSGMAGRDTTTVLTKDGPMTATRLF